MSDYYGAAKELRKQLEAMTELPVLDAGISYEWDTFMSWYDAESRIFYWRSDGGCSCNYFWDFVDSLADFNVGRKEDLLRAASTWKGDLYNELEDADYQRFIKAVREIKVPA